MARRGAGAPGGGVHLHHDRHLGAAGKTPSVDQALVYVRLVPKAERDISPGRAGRVLRREMAQHRRREGLGVHQRLRRRVQADPDPAEGPRRAGAHRAGPAAPRGGRARCRARWTSVSRPGARSPSWRSELNRGLAGSLGVTVGQVAQSLRPAFAGIDAGDWVDPSGETRDVTVRLAPEARERITDLEQLPLVAGAGPDGAADDAAAGPGRHDPAGHRAGADRPPRPREGGDRAGQRRRAARSTR